MEVFRRRKIFVVVSFVLLVSFSVIVYSIFNPVQEDLSENVLGRIADSAVPYIVSLPPVVGYEEELYEYDIRVVDMDTELEYLFLEYVEGPKWLVLEDFNLSGIVPLGSKGAHKVVLKVSDGINTSVQEEYILVEERNERE